MLKSNISTSEFEYRDEKTPIAQVFVFRDETCLGWDYFYKHSIQIGSHSESDLFLDHPSIAGKHAVIYVKGDNIVVSAKAHDADLCVNHVHVMSAILRPLDFVNMGPFTLKVKIPEIKGHPSIDSKGPKRVPRLSMRPKVVEKWKKRPQEKTQEPSDAKARDYRIIFKGDLIEGFKPETVKANLCALLPSDPNTVTSYLEKRRSLVTHNISMDAAKKYCLAFKKAGARCTIEAVATDPNNRSENVEKIPVVFPLQKDTTVEFEPGEDKKKGALNKDNASTSAKVPTPQPAQQMHPDEDDDLEEEEVIRPFLKTDLLESAYTQVSVAEKACVLEIIKFKDDTIFDLQYLSPKEKYSLDKSGKRFCLAKYTSKKACHVFFRGDQSGFITNPGKPDKRLAELCTRENLHQKKKRIFSTTISTGQTCRIEEDGYHYHLQLVPRQDSPKVSISTTHSVPFYKSILKSSGLHVFLMVFMSLFLSLPEMPGPKEPESHFVKIDIRQLQKPEPLRPEPKPLPPKVVKPIETKKTVTQKKVIPPPKKRVPKTAQNTNPASSPKAGGGSGKTGNVKTRNVKETGILGLIGDSIGLTTKEALASVTNLDIVSSPGTTGKNFKIGGIAGKIPGSKVELVAGDVVRSKGTRQVLRSAGMEGKGEVAALSKGQTGQNKVMAMVSVDLDKSVRVQGGLSREEVKRIIDQHLDEISFCYENALMDVPSLMGNIVFEWKILMSGKVGAVRIKSSTIRSSQIHNCIQAAIKSWQFPKPQNAEVMVSYPFVFDIVGF
ncbi:MAG: AgmX/PglI C-terminal domain-containing protein [Desulfobacterales bacterium]|nr:AgmX/PglI C-terminal domain-containing protein [Desulfobacterales bacterium]MDX2512739.1 AgmX/PglI C-terminal domain-containing protein [Desulfobacterales bacterium]